MSYPDDPPLCPGCPHPPHIGVCLRRHSGTAYHCRCTKDSPATRDAAPKPPPGADEAAAIATKWWDHLETPTSLNRWPVLEAAREAFAAGQRRGLDALAQLRAAGWKVAVHNDYHVIGGWRTFWGFSNGARWVKGEGYSDEEAIGQAAAEIARLDAMSTRGLTEEINAAMEEPK